MSLLTKAATNLARWHFAIATIFEATKYLHQLGLYFYLPTSEYGLVGTTFCLAYLSAHLAGLEQGNALLPHVATITRHPQRFPYVINSILIPQAIQSLFGAVCVGWSLSIITENLLLISSGMLISFGEGIRCGLRPLIYAASRSHHAARDEAFIAYGYITIIWLIWLLYAPFFTSTSVTLLYAATSLLSCCYLLYIGYQAIKAEQVQADALPLPSRFTIAKTQASLLIIHLPHNLFSANFLVPFFAYQGGLALAGTLKISSEIAGAIKTIIKSSIGFPLNALLNGGHPTNTQERALIFATIKQTTLRAAAILAIACGVGACIALIPLAFYTKIIFISFCMLIVADYLCMPYELLSIHTGATNIVASIRFIEVIFDVLIMTFLYQWPLAALGGISLTRFITWKVLAEGAERPALFFAAVWRALKTNKHGRGQ